MPREILFRGKYIHTFKNEHIAGSWVYGYLRDAIHIYSPKLMGEYLIDPETVCQYTGLTDKNGMKIFEGDIVKTKFFGKDNGNGQNFADYDIFKIVYKDGIYLLENNRRRFSAQYIPDMMGNGIEVIGNIFDNPELTKES